MWFNMRPEICRKGSISKRSDGYWLGTIYYLNEYGQRKRKAFGGKLKKIVKRKMTDYITEFNKKAAEYEYGNKLLKDTLLEYMKEIKFFSVRRITYDRCESLVKNQVIPRLEMKKTGEIVSSDIQKVLYEMMSEGYSYSMVKKTYYLLREFYRYNVTKGRINNDPSEGVTLMRERNFLSAQGKEIVAKCDEIIVLTEEEIAIIKKEAFSLKQDGSRKHPHVAAYFLMLNTGLRRGEVLGLRNSDIDLKNRALYVNRSVGQARKRIGSEATDEYEIIIGPPKTLSSKRKIPLNDTAIKMIKDLRNEAYFGENSPLIPDENGKVLSPNQFSYRYAKLIKACGLTKTGIHCLRHTFATVLVNGHEKSDGSRVSLPIKQVADLLGHTTTCITERYYVKREPKHLIGITDDFLL